MLLLGGTIDYYWIKTDEGLFKVKYNMKLKCDGVEGEWMQVADTNMNQDESMAENYHCFGGCASSHFYVKEVSYEHICRQAKAYQKGNVDAF